MKTLKQIAEELVNSEANNEYGIQCDAIIRACNKYGVSFRELWAEVIKVRDYED